MEKETNQKIKFSIFKLNEEYKMFMKNVKNRKALFFAQIFVSLIAIFLGQLFTLVEYSNLIGKIGSLSSSLFGGAGVIVTIFTAYFNYTSEKYLEGASETKIEDKTFKLMHLHIEEELLGIFSATYKDEDQKDKKGQEDKKLLSFYISKLRLLNSIFYKERMVDIIFAVLFFLFILSISIFLSLIYQDTGETYVGKNAERALRHALMYLGEIWFGLIILSKSLDVYDNLKILTFRRSSIKVANIFIELFKIFFWIVNIFTLMAIYYLIIGRIKMNKYRYRYHLFRMVRLKLYPAEILNIELILNGIKPIVYDKDDKRPEREMYEYIKYDEDKVFKRFLEEISVNEKHA
ncbi:7866_t:CDS:1 [Cetraspora pellucida]|uniref:7866_t:CDS:1 n=1 Tax=Cetraspora pellucida TaxID=1433469 RepID=A0A9N9BVY6_9GLOM|nr:7866_t:CDS:1 [Cetraspora pellucida]